MNNACIILAAGIGKRMSSPVPKVLHSIYGIPMLQYVINTAQKLKPEKTIVIVGKHADLIKESIDSENVLFALQKKPMGTAHAFLCAKKALKNFEGVLIVLNGDTPLVSHNTIKKFLSLHRKNKNTISVLSFIATDPDNYGRIVRDDSGRVLSIIEDKDANHMQKKIHEVNSGVYAIDYSALHLLKQIKINRLKGEFYLTDIVGLSLKKGLKTSVYCIGTEEEFMGVNTKNELYQASKLMKSQIINKWINKGVSFIDTDSVFIHPYAYIGERTLIYPNVYIEGHTRIGRGSTIYPNVRIKSSNLGDKVVIQDSTVIEDSTVKSRASVGPFARVRPGSEIGSKAKIGNFVELKKAIIGKKTRASHLSYLGDTRIGKGVNIGAGTITCNYDGEKKHVTIIDDNVFVGSDTQLIAPVKVGKGAYIGASSTITKDVPAGALALSRVSQKNIENWAKRKALHRLVQGKVQSKKRKKKGVGTERQGAGSKGQRVSSK